MTNMKNIEPWFTGYICQTLDDSKLHYHHCKTWFRLFPNEDVNTYSIKGVKNKNNENEVIVYKGKNISWCINTKAPIIFQGTLQNFKKWLETVII